VPAVQCAAMLSDLVSLIRRPLVALSTIDRERPASYGLIGLVLSVLLPAATAELGAFGPFRPPADLGSLPTLTAQGAEIYARWIYAHRFLLPLYGILISLVLWLVAAGIIYGIAHALRGQGDFLGFLKLAGYIEIGR